MTISIFGLPSLIFIIFIVIAVSIIVMIGVRAISSGEKSSPELSVSAKVVAKRMQVSSHRNIADPAHFHSSTDYYATFEMESGERVEFGIPDSEYGFLVEQDSGMLTFQGTKLISFVRG